MTLTLNPEIEVSLRSVASERGIAPEQLHEDLLREALAEAKMKRQETAAARQARIERFQQWAESNGHNTPLLSNEAVSRGTVYGER